MEIAKVTSNGQITIPADIRRRLNIKDGDKVLFLEGDDGVLMLNSSMIALKQSKKVMEGEAVKIGSLTEEGSVADSKKQKDALDRLYAGLKAINDEPFDEEFDAIINQRFNIARELDL